MSERLRRALKQSMREGDKAAVSAFRSVLSEIENAAAVTPSQGRAETSEHVAGAATGVGATEAHRAVLTEAQQRDIAWTEVDHFLSQADHFEGLDRHDEAASAQHAAQVVRSVVEADCG